MKAVVYRKYGPPEVLRVGEVDKPSPKGNQILVRVCAAEVTKGDCEMRGFNFPVKWFAFPLRLAMGVFSPRKHILGGYFSGVVEELGEKVTRFSVGDEVFGATRLLFGAHAEYLAIPESYTVVPKPENASFEEAAGVPLGGLNALHFIRKAELKAGEKILINGAGGSIGTFGLQIAKAMGAVVTVVDSNIKETMLKSIGADFFIDYEKVDFRTGPETYDVIFDMVASSPLEESLEVLNPGGRYVTANPTFKKMTSAGNVFKKTGKKVIFAFAGETEEELLTLKTMIEAGTIRTALDKVFPMSQVVDAHKRVEAEQRLGVVVLSMGEQHG